MIYTVGDKKEANLQYQFEFKDDTVKIIPVDLADDNTMGMCIEADKAEFMQIVDAIKFVESGFKAKGDMLALASTIKDMLAEFQFTTPILDGNDKVAYDAFAMRVVELLMTDILDKVD